MFIAPGSLAAIKRLASSSHIKTPATLHWRASSDIWDNSSSLSCSRCSGRKGPDFNDPTRMEVSGPVTKQSTTGVWVASYSVVVLEVLESVDFSGEDFSGEDFSDKDKDFSGEDKDFSGEDSDVLSSRSIFSNLTFSDCIECLIVQVFCFFYSHLQYCILLRQKMSAEMSAGHEGRSCQGCWQNFHRTLREETSGMILASLQLKKNTWSSD